MQLSAYTKIAMNSKFIGHFTMHNSQKEGVMFTERIGKQIHPEDRLQDVSNNRNLVKYITDNIHLQQSMRIEYRYHFT
jgi:hypothetical protein